MSRYYQQEQTGSTTAPTTPLDVNGAPIGLVLGDAYGYRLTIAAGGEATLLGTGNMFCMMWHPGLALWCRNPELDFAVTEDVAGFVAATFGEVECVVRDAVQVYYYPDGDLASAGAITMRLDRSEVGQ